MKKTAQAPSNIAFVKYWGKTDEDIRLPANGSISMNLSRLMTTTTVEFDATLPNDHITIDGKHDAKESARVSSHLDMIRSLAGKHDFAHVVSHNSFPAGTGLSSSASGFAALTVAAVAAVGLSLGERELTILARKGSGSACRSIPDGFVYWVKGDSDETSYAYSLYPSKEWDLHDVVAVVSRGRKDVPTSEGQKTAATSPFFATRLSGIENKLSRCIEAIQKRDFTTLGELSEAEAFEMHAVMLTSTPPLLYWLPNSLHVMREVRRWRKEGQEAYATVNTGQDVHVLCQAKDCESIRKKLLATEGVIRVMDNIPAPGAHLTEDHLW